MQFKNNYPIILASASPRRQELLASLGFPFDVIPSKKMEPDPKDFYSPIAYVTETAEQKAREVADAHPGHIVIGADTIVVWENEVLLKPANAEEARNYLEKLSGHMHNVVTAVAVIDGKKSMPFYERTEVTFRDLPASWISGYVATEDPYDKAGGYGIQTAGKLFVEKIYGDYNNVVGLPISRLAHLLDSCGYISVKGGEEG
ncbi:Maf family protein [Planococcus lenghuensis]|uniref:dTTP/UTP pyrophosphatase n=1 Tax=Planococcus lenghuensis TaxID=2213202 RepID=A0A1Q2KXP6_9BACL|nr:Maf family protein [Planococcus lenghuensis]AQQ52896.1 septum formation protein Maf [Planococcus lenghuensis]